MEKNFKQFIEDSKDGEFEGKTSLKEYLIEEAEYEPEYIEDLSDKDLLDHYLQYIGVVGFTSDIINAVASAYNLK